MLFSIMDLFNPIKIEDFGIFNDSFVSKNYFYDL